METETNTYIFNQEPVAEAPVKFMVYRDGELDKSWYYQTIARNALRATMQATARGLGAVAMFAGESFVKFVEAAQDELARH